MRYIEEINRINSETIIYKDRFEALRQSTKLCSLDGDFFEFGVFVGTTINFIADLCPYRRIYGFDSWLGLPTDWNKGFKAGSFSTHGKKPKVRSNVVLIDGWFGGPNGSVKSFFDKYDKTISFMHIDCDVYESTKTILDNTVKLFKPGLVIQFDELIVCDNSHEHELKAWLECVDQYNLSYRYLYRTHECQVSVLIT